MSKLSGDNVNVKLWGHTEVQDTDSEFISGMRGADLRLVGRVRELAQGRFKQRAAEFDEKAIFPEDDFQDLFDSGMLGAAVPKAHGGLGLGPPTGDILTLWMMTKELARVDLSLGRCWEGHCNSLALIEGRGSSEQKRRWFEGVVRNGDKWVAWSGEPLVRKPGEPHSAGTQVEKVSGGYIVSGSKVFSTSAGSANYAILLVNPAGPGGARDSAGKEGSLLMLVCDLSDSSITFDHSWWNPIGMRATVSHRVCFDKTFIPEEDLLGAAGDYLRQGWQTRFIPHYAASFLGAAEEAFYYSKEYVLAQRKTSDPFIQQHLGQMSVNIETGHLWLRHAAQLWEEEDDDAPIAGGQTRYLVERLALETVELGVRVCGARCLNRPSVLERIYRDLSIYIRHDNRDHILAMIGRSAMGEAHDISFFKP